MVLRPERLGVGLDFDWNVATHLGYGLDCGMATGAPNIPKEVGELERS